jgi:uncharacterized membrane protein YkoI
MKRNTRIAVAVGALTVIIGAAGAAIVGATTGDSETPITGADLERASAAALAHTGGGRVTETEVGDEESYYEVEVTLDDGSQVDVQLDERFQVVGTEADNDSETDEGDDGSD